MHATHPRTPYSQLLCLLAALLLISPAMADSIEEPQYELLGKLGEVEIRRYAPSIQAVTELPDYGGKGFRRLAGYIFGGNDQEQSIAMTAPVQETIGSGEREMAFTMPSEYAYDELPAPDDNAVSLREIEARTVAVILFSGLAGDAKTERKWQELSSALSEAGIATTSSPMLNQYNPPWTLPFLRRNEVMVEISADSVPDLAAL